MDRPTIEFRATRPGIESLPDRLSLPRHRHLRPYASIVLSGSFDEIGYLGRIRATPGDVLIHPAMDCHANEMVSGGVRLLRLEWPEGAGLEGYYRVNEVEELARVGAQDPREATALLSRLMSRQPPPPAALANDWPDLLAAALNHDQNFAIGAWARANGLSAEAVSRGFKRAYRVSPVAFRAERRARAAWLLTTRTRTRLSEIATTTGFADQAHMTRWVHWMTGAPPAAWRRPAHSNHCS